MGGVIAQDGFDYQTWDALARLPAWLKNPAFEHLMLEGLEDFEARFFAPQAPQDHLLDRFQAKGSQQTPAKAREVFDTFLKFEKAYPRVARMHTLVTPLLSKDIAWLAQDSDRVRNARPFYSPFGAVTAASDRALADNLVREYGNELGQFILDSVEVSERNYPDRDNALNAFGSALDRAFPSLDIGPKKIADAFDALLSLATRSRGRLLSRHELLGLIEQKVGRSLPLPQVFPLHFRSDRNGTDETAFEIDASAFSGTGGFPGAETWREDLLLPLDKIATWLRKRQISRVGVAGSYRLSTALSIGWSLRSATGFELEIATRDGVWMTDDRPTGEIPPVWSIRQPAKLDGDRLNLTIGIIRDPASDLQTTADVSSDTVLALHLPAAITSAREAQLSVGIVKREIEGTVARLRPAKIALFIAGPAAFAMALGHRWNALPPTQLHEFLASTRRYVATALIG
jgi:hypothetical protein